MIVVALVVVATLRLGVPILSLRRVSIILAAGRGSLYRTLLIHCRMSVSGERPHVAPVTGAILLLLTSRVNDKSHLKICARAHTHGRIESVRNCSQRTQSVHITETVYIESESVRTHYSRAMPGSANIRYDRSGHRAHEDARKQMTIYPRQRDSMNENRQETNAEDEEESKNKNYDIVSGRIVAARQQN